MPPSTSNRHDDIVANLAATAAGVLGDVLEAGDVCSLLDAPTTANWGDHAIWLGERRMLASLGVRVAYESDDALFDDRRIARGPILLHGGGSVGDIYPARQRFRERVLATYPRRKVIQLPQSIWFDRKDSLEQAKRAFGSHKRLVMLVRDQPSMAFAEANFDVECRLCPDMAFAIGPIRRPRPADVGVLWLDRQGPEATGRRPPVHPDVLVGDWGPTAVRRPTNRIRFGPGAVDHVLRKLRDGTPLPTDALRRRLLRHLPHHKVALAVDFLAQGEVVVTNRLHGHILAVLLGIPHVLLENRIGKLRAFHSSWTANVPTALFARSPAEALVMAQNLRKSSNDPAKPSS